MAYKVNMTESFATGDIPATSSTYAKPGAWARDQIALRSRDPQKIPFFYKASLGFMISRLGNLVYINSEDEVIPIKCVHANPERTIAKLKQENNIILPVISIHQNTSDNDEKRRRPETSLINTSWWSDKKQRAFRVISLSPKAITVEYGINIWTKYKNNMDQIAEQIRLLFNPHLIVNTKYSNVSHAFLDMESDNSSVESSDRQDRILRRTFKVKLEAYIPNPKFLITSTGEIEEFNAETTLY
jgi:hypothetical protein